MDQFRENIRRIKNDNQSGSTTILKSLINDLYQLLSGGKIINRVQLIREIDLLLEVHSNFAVLVHFISQFKEQLIKNYKEKELAEFVTGYQKKWNNANNLAVQKLLKEIDLSQKTILIHSNSSAIRTLFTVLSERGIYPGIYQTLSRPANEGKVQAEILAGMGFKITLIDESSTGNFIQNMDMVVFGADLVSRDIFLNKSGTFPISLLFKYYNKPVYVLTDSRKFLNTNKLPRNITKHLLKEKEKDPAELWDYPPSNVTPKNLYFEYTPNTLVEKFFTE